MITLLILIAFGLGVAYLATQNTGLVHIVVGNYMISGIPLYAIVIGAILLGIFISWLISLVDSLSSLFTLHGKDVAIQRAQKTIDKLQAENQVLSLEIARLEGKVPPKEQSLDEEKITSKEPSFLHHLSRNFN